MVYKVTKRKNVCTCWVQVQVFPRDFPSTVESMVPGDWSSVLLYSSVWSTTHFLFIHGKCLFLNHLIILHVLCVNLLPNQRLKHGLWDVLLPFRTEKGTGDSLLGLISGTKQVISQGPEDMEQPQWSSHAKRSLVIEHRKEILGGRPDGHLLS